MARVTNFKFCILLMGVLIVGAAWPQTVAADAYSDCLQKNEGAGGNPAKTNPWGYTGLYQFGVNAAAGSGLCKNAGSMTEYSGTQNWQTFNAECDFKGSIAQKYGIKSYADWSSGPYAAQIQGEMLEIFKANSWKELVNNGVSKYEGKTINGITFTKDALLAMAHLKGATGLLNALNGTGKTTDKNGTSIWGYANCLSKCMTNGGDQGECSFKYAGACDAAKTGN